MGRVFEIKIRVEYDDEYPVPENMVEQLGFNVDFAIEHGLLDDANQEVLVEKYDASVEEK